jgi:hypothetical protein
MKFIPIIFLSIFLSLSGFSQRPQGSGQAQQEVVVRGTVVSLGENQALPGAHVSLVSQRDTTRIFRAITNINGVFSLDLPRGDYSLVVTYMGFEPVEQNILASEAVNDAGRIAMSLLSEVLGEVIISGRAPTTHQRGDTTAYNATAFKTNPDANAEDLIRKMPGITVEGGQVSAQGEQVQRVLVDGREFFGDDPNIALRNLPAEMIEQIEVFDRLSDQAQLTGFDDGEAVKTINIVTREDRRNGQFGRVYSGYGDQERYQAGLVTNVFMGDRRISILGMSNNVNQQNFSSEDMSSFFGSSGRGGRGSRGSGGPGGSDFFVGQVSGLNNTNSLGVNYSDKWKEKVEASGSYFFNFMKNRNESLSDRQYFLGDDASQLYVEENSSDSRNMNHRFSGRIEYEINDNNTLIFSPRFRYQDSRSNSYNNASSFLPDMQFLNMSISGYERNWDGFSYNNNLVYRLRLNENGRSISSRLNFNVNNNKNLYFLDALSEFYEGPVLVEDLIDQQSNSRTNSMGVSGRVNYSEPLSEKSMLQFAYNVSYSDNESNRLTNSWDIQSQGYTIFENDLSSELTNGYLTQNGELSYRFRDEKINLQAEVAYQNAGLSALQTTPYFADLSRTYSSFLPSLRFTYNLSKTQNIRIQYRTRTNAPSVSQLQDVVDNTNPLLLRTGNPDLEQTYSHYANIRFNLANPAKSRTFLLFFFGSLSNDVVATSTLIAGSDTILPNGMQLPKGGQFSQPVNLDGYGSIRSMITYGFMANPIKTNINFNGGVGYTRSPGLINGQENVSNTLSFSAGVVFSSNISENLDFTLNYRGNYNVVENSLRPQLNNNYFYHLSGAKVSWIFLKNWVLRNDLYNYMYTGLGEDFNENYWLWNVSFGRKFLANDLGELTLGVYDLLDQSKSVTRNVTSNYVEDVRTNVLNRYFMLTFTYKIRNFGVGR